MDSKKCNEIFVQCQYCGNIYRIDQSDFDDEVSIDELMIDAFCPKCGYTRALNCGDSEDDIYLYINESLDPRYYLY